MSVKSFGSVFAASIVFQGPLPIAQDFGKPSEVFTDGDRMVVALPPSLICGPKVLKFQWSRDGSTIFVVRRIANYRPEVAEALMRDPKAVAPDARFELGVWTTTGQNWRALKSWTDPDIRVHDISFIGKTGAANVLFGDSHGHYSMQLISAAGVARTIWEGENGYETFPSPAEPIFYCVQSEGKTKTLHLFNTSGNIVRSQPLEPNEHVLGWTGKGDAVMLDIVTRVGTQGSRAINKEQFRLLDIRGVQEVDSLDSYYEGVRIGAQPTWAMSVDGELRDPTGSVPVGAARVGVGEKSGESALLSSDGSAVDVNEPRTYAAYISNDALFVRGLAQVDKVAYEKLQHEAQVRQAMDYAKQAGTGILMYSSDYDGDMPLAHDLTESVNPYIKNQRILDGFYLTYRGGNTEGIEHPDQVEMGYRRGPGGRAVVYMDGSVRWIADP